MVTKDRHKFCQLVWKKEIVYQIYIKCPSTNILQRSTKKTVISEEILFLSKKGKQKYHARNNSKVANDSIRVTCIEGGLTL